MRRVLIWPDNTRVHPEVVILGELAPNPAMTLFPLHALHFLPPTVHHTIVCLSLNHHIHSLPVGTNKKIAMKNKSKVHHYRGAAIQSLSHYIGQEKTRCSDVTIASILMFMSVEVNGSKYWCRINLILMTVIGIKSFADRLAISRKSHAASY